jgi:hypothetical protein
MVSPVRVTRVRVYTAAIALSVTVACGERDAPPNTYPGIDGHARYLPLRGTAHDPSGPASATSCEGCHPGTSFKQFLCTGCHTAALTDPIHASSLAPGYVPGAVTSADCYRCHPDGAGIAPATHGLKFPIGTAAHPAVCRMCHTDPASRGDVTRLACVTCHEAQAGFATAHSQVRDYPVAVTAPWCLRCHADGQVDRIASHGRQAVAGGKQGGGGPGDGNHDTRCFTCHSMVPPYPLFGGPGAGLPNRPWAQDWKQAGCTPCH